MALFLDTGKIDLVRKYHAMGIVRGVTTNPTILVKEGSARNLAEVEKQIREVAELIHPLPVSVEVTSNDEPQMLKQAQAFSKWGTNINVKIPIHGPAGELFNLRLVRELESTHNIRINVTAMMNAQQCFLAALAGATFVSLFGGRVNDMGYNACAEIHRIRMLLDRFQLKAKLILGSTREPLNVIEWLEAGADIVTVRPELIDKVLIHPYSLETVKEFVREGAKIEKGLS